MNTQILEKGAQNGRPQGESKCGFTPHLTGGRETPLNGYKKKGFQLFLPGVGMFLGLVLGWPFTLFSQTAITLPASSPAMQASTVAPATGARPARTFPEMNPLAVHLDIILIAGQGKTFVAGQWLGKTLSFFCFGEAMTSDLCWGPCKEEAFNSYHQPAAASKPALLSSEGRPAITAVTLTALIASRVPLILVDARKPVGKKRIPGSVVFPIASRSADIPMIVVVYGGKEMSPESRQAADALRTAGFSNVIELKEGLEGWLAAGLPSETGE